MSTPHAAHAETPGTLKPVHVTRNGNARTLSIPVEIAQAADIHVGDLFQVEVSGDVLLYRRLTTPRTPRGFVGSGLDRVLVLFRSAGMAVGPDPSPVSAIDWDF